MSEFEQTERTTLKRLPLRGSYDKDVVYAILDEAYLCHVGFEVGGQPYVIPTGYARVGDRLYIHGSAASRMLRTLTKGVRVCVTVTLIDGLVLARSAFHHSMNYRSVVALGTAHLVESDPEKLIALRALSDQIIPQRWEEVREPDRAEMKATSVLCLPLTEVSAKVRSGPPLDDETDLDRKVWAGVLPLQMIAGPAVRDPFCDAEIPIPEYVQNYTRKNESEKTASLP